MKTELTQKNKRSHRWRATSCKSVALLLFLCLIFSLGMPVTSSAQNSMLINCSIVEESRLIMSRVAAGQYHSLALGQDKKIWGWGNNSCGQIGNGEITVWGVQTTPSLVSGEGFVDIAAGYQHSLALKSDGTVWAWGSNDDGQLGYIGSGNHPVPEQIPNLAGVAAIACGDYFSLALKSDGSVWAWGKNDFNQLGTGSGSLMSNSPQRVKGLGGSGYLTNIKAIACGSVHSLALGSNGAVWAWGAGSWGNLGNGEDFADGSYPVRVSNLTNVRSIDAGSYFSLALRNDGTVWAWGGRNWVGCLGDGGTEGFVSIPQPVRGLNGVGNLNNIKAIACGAEHSLALNNDGRILAWGGNYGRLGDNSDKDRAIPVLTAGLSTGVMGIAAGWEHSLAWKDDGTVWAWGSNHHYQLGGEESSQTPALVGNVRILAGVLSGLSIKAAGGGEELLTCYTPQSPQSPQATDYNLTVENPLDKVKVTPVPAYGATAVVKINGNVVQANGIVDLNVEPGLNKVEVVVSEPGKSSLVYTVNIKRLRLADPLIGLSVKGGADGSGSEYMTGFDGNILDYGKLEVENDVNAVRVAPVVTPGSSAVVKLNGAVQIQGVVNLALGWNNAVSIEVSQPDRSMRTYALEIGRKPYWKTHGFANWPVGADKNWIIKFSSPVNTATAADNIYVSGAAGRKVAVDLVWSEDKKNVTVKPQQPYTTGAIYILHVRPGLKSEQGTSLKGTSAVMMPFRI